MDLTGTRPSCRVFYKRRTDQAARRSARARVREAGPALQEPACWRTGLPINAAVPAEMRSPASRLLQIGVDANAGEPSWRRGRLISGGAKRVGSLHPFCEPSFKRLAQSDWRRVSTVGPVLLALVHAFAPVPWRWVQTFTQYLGVGFKRLPRSSWHGFKHLAKPCRSRLAGEPGYLVNAAVPAEMRSPASLFLQVWVGANGGEPCWLL
jgi:hypothetical protein